MRLLFQPFPTPGQRRAQCWRYQPAFRRPRHVHDEAEFNLVLHGRGVLGVGAKRLPLRAGTLVWLPPGVDHVLEEASDDFDLLVVGYQRELLDAYDREHGRVPVFARTSEELPSPRRSHLAGALHAASVMGDDAVAEQTLLQVLAELQGPPHASISPIQRAAQMLHVDFKAGRDALAKRVGINRGDLSRGFKRMHAMSLSEYKNRLRLVRFLDNVANPNARDNLLQSALGAGFGSYAQCHRVFRRVVGTSPREYLRVHFDEALEQRFDPFPLSASGRR